MSNDPMDFSKEELARYNRHIILPEFGLEAQKKLKGARVLVIGSGGLGSPVLLYLAAAGVGTIGIVDFDSVDPSNLQRQIIFSTDDSGIHKTTAAKNKLQALNPHINILTHQTQLKSSNALEILKNYDIIADGSDNFPTRYLVNDACVLLGKPLVYASIYQFEGQVSVFNLRNANGEHGPNYRDFYPVPPSAGSVPNCAEGGVLGVLAGIIGSLQALEVIKVITGTGETLSGRFYIFDALTFTSHTIKIKSNPSNPPITQLIDYDEFCSSSPTQDTIKEITAHDLQFMLQNKEDFQLIDVREPEEYNTSNIGGELIPLKTITANIDKINRNKKVIIHCQTGARSKQAILELQEKFGFTNLYKLEGGCQNLDLGGLNGL